MELDLMKCIIIIFFGFVGAFINATVGGGGLITLPALLSVGLPPSAAIATNKLAASMGNLTSSLTFFKAGKIDIKLLVPILPFVFIFSMLGAWTVHLMDSELLRPLIILMLIAVLIYTLLKKNWGQLEDRKPFDWKRGVLFVASLLLIGFYDGFFGPGTGSFIMFVFIIAGFDFLQAAGNAKLINFISNIAALIMFLILGEVVFLYGFIMGGAMIAGAFFGTKFALSKGTSFVRMLFIIITVILIIKNIYDYWSA
ncbi:TSUP family transporter [Ureibacillus sinduriensis]|uniref:Probable membrane transporter protein n=1 Tax=Ureibacillus sinduriensis BLB-1 = JCM 15800 TaxID=1384057 RepID=A0A0A3HPW0_9BACL|nr:TSUP family transporter [Ureibacillus sinduriensis]KGR74621.1 membrane protein [Ureibacillus sinduriensis BLB-1 = JCM 15800]